MQYEALKTEYLCYLMNCVNIKAEGPDGYLALCQFLQNFSFIPIVYFDDNRCEDCQNLRYRFNEEYGDILNECLPLSGTFMELLVILSERFMFETATSKYESTPDKWFMEMLTNCGLNGFTNAVIQVSPGTNWRSSRNKVTDILTSINMRLFNWDGEGSFFPLKNPNKDQRYLEIIVQMNNYIEENYDIC